MPRSRSTKGRLIRWIRHQPQPVCAHAVCLQFGLPKETVLAYLRGEVAKGEHARICRRFARGVELFERWPLTISQRVLRLLEGHPSLLRKEIAAHLDVPQPSLSYPLRSLLKTGAIASAESEEGLSFMLAGQAPAARKPQPVVRVRSQPAPRPTEAVNAANSVFAWRGAQ